MSSILEHNIETDVLYHHHFCKHNSCMCCHYKATKEGHIFWLLTLQPLKQITVTHLYVWTGDFVLHAWCK